MSPSAKEAVRYFLRVLTHVGIKMCFFIKKWTMLAHDQQVFLNPWYGAGSILPTGDVAENKAGEISLPSRDCHTQ